jgi:cyclophilin family peptidyl-prolyl cis-trans isomerase
MEQPHQCTGNNDGRQGYSRPQEFCNQWRPTAIVIDYIYGGPQTAYVPTAFARGAYLEAVRPDDDPSPIKIEVVQGGLTDESKYLAPIAHEPTSRTGLRHGNGTLSIARDAVGTGTAGAFFICIGDQPELDFGGKRNPDGQGFAAFGHVTSGMKLVRTIWSSKTQGTSRVFRQGIDCLSNPDFGRASNVKTPSTPPATVPARSQSFPEIQAPTALR